MKKRLVVLMMACAIAMAGCGNTATSQDTTTDGAAAAQESPDASRAETEGTEAEEAGAEAADDMGEALTPDENGKVSNGFMSITMPKEMAGTYLAYCFDKDINIYDKESSEAGCGGFAFGVCVAESYDEYGGMRTKIGELTDGDGKRYHVLISYPSDVQWDVTKSEEAPASYMALYDGGREIAKTLQPDNGGEYVDGAGTKGEEIYSDTVKDVINAIQNAKSAEDLEAKELSPVYYAMTQGDDPKDPMKAIGIAYTDFNQDGVDEMVIGDMESKQIYDIFACVDGKGAHVASGHWRDYYKVFGPVLAEYVPEGAGVSAIYSYSLQPNSTELFPQYALKLDETDGAKYKWSVSYDKGDTWEELTEEDYKQRLSNIEEFPVEEEPHYTALGSL